MAEILGIVASGIAVAQLTGQVGEAVAKLVKLWSQVQDLPESIADLLEELAEMDPLMACIETALLDQQLGDHLWMGDPLVQSLGNSKRAISVLRDVATDLDEKIRAARGVKRKLLNVKISLKREYIKRMERKLSRSLRTLQLSWNLYNT